MKMDVFGYCPKRYKEQVRKWAKRLEADEVTIHCDRSVTLMCEDGCICYRYNPQPCELQKGEKR